MLNGGKVITIQTFMQVMASKLNFSRYLKMAMTPISTALLIKILTLLRMESKFYGQMTPKCSMQTESLKYPKSAITLTLQISNHPSNSFLGSIYSYKSTNPIKDFNTCISWDIRWPINSLFTILRTSNCKEKTLNLKLKTLNRVKPTVDFYNYQSIFQILTLIPLKFLFKKGHNHNWTILDLFCSFNNWKKKT